jgi:hypothetical protein
VHIGASTKKAIATGVSFPLSDEATEHLARLQRGSITYIQLVRGFLFRIMYVLLSSMRSSKLLVP